MKTRYGRFVLFSLVCLRSSSFGARADDPGHAAVPNVVGTWTWRFKLSIGQAQPNRPWSCKSSQDGPLVKGEKRWRIKPGVQRGMSRDRIAGEAAEPLVGVIGCDAQWLAEQGDSESLYRAPDRSRYPRGRLYRGWRPGDRLSGGAETGPSSGTTPSPNILGG